MNTISGISSSTYSSYTSFSLPDTIGAAGVGANLSGLAAVSNGIGGSGSGGGLSIGSLAGVDGSMLHASFEQAMTSGDPMRMLVAMLVLNLLMGNDDGKEKTKDALAGLGALAMLGQLGASSFTQSTSLTISQQSANGAYTVNSSSSTSSFSAMG